MTPDEIVKALRISLPAELYTYETLPDGRTITYCTMRQQVFHCIGMVDSCSQRHKPYHRHGKTFYKPWRNYFCTSADSEMWVLLCKAGYADHGEIHDHDGINPSTTFWMTRNGLDWMGEQLGMTIHDEED